MNAGKPAGNQRFLNPGAVREMELRQDPVVAIRLLRVEAEFDRGTAGKPIEFLPRGLGNRRGVASRPREMLLRRFDPRQADDPSVGERRAFRRQEPPRPKPMAAQG